MRIAVTRFGMRGCPKAARQGSDPEGAEESRVLANGGGVSLRKVEYWQRSRTENAPLPANSPFFSAERASKLPKVDFPQHLVIQR